MAQKAPLQSVQVYGRKVSRFVTLIRVCLIIIGDSMSVLLGGSEIPGTLVSEFAEMKH